MPAYSQDADIEKVKSLNKQARNLYQQSRYPEAVQVAEKVLAIHEKTLGPEHPVTVKTRNKLASLYKDRGDFTKSDTIDKRSLPTHEKAGGPKPPSAVSKPNSLPSEYYYEYIFKRDYVINELNYKEALATREKTLGPEHPDTAKSVDDLAWHYYIGSNYQKAGTLFKRALAILEKAPIPENSNTTTSLNNLARLYQDMGDYAKAEPLYKRSLAILEKVMGPEHPYTSISLSNLAGLYFHMGDYARAESLYKRVLAIREKALGPEHPSTGTCLHNLAWLYAALNRIDDAHELLKHVQAIDEKMIDQVLGFASSSHQISFLSQKKNNLDAFFSLVNRHLSDNGFAKIDAVNSWLRRKGVILEAQRQFQEALVYSDSSEAVQTFQELSRNRALLSKMTFSGPGKAGVETYKNNLARLEQQQENLEARLSKLSKAFALRQKTIKADCSQVAKNLPPHTVLVEFARFSEVNFNAKGVQKNQLPDRYLAFIIHPGAGDQVDWIDLGKAEIIDSAIAEFKKEMADKNTNAARTYESSRKLFDLVFEPLRKKFGNVKSLLISPDGNLNLIPFEVLQGPDGRFLIEDYTFNYLAAGRDVLGFGAIQRHGNKALIIGDPDFDLGKKERDSTTRRLALVDPDRDHTAKRSAEVEGFHFTRLPGTRKEVEAIASLMGNEKTSVYIGREAVEELLFQKNTPTILHLATHGFFLDDLDLSSIRGERGIAVVSDVAKPMGRKVIKIENPLLRSGIALAGANRSLKSSDTKESDGLVTAEKILGLTLRGTDMVVLSACETGLGEVKAGEGVYGLRRAFTQAGSRSIVMSMWSVPDRETKELMIEFYKNIQSGKMNRCQALRQAALKQIQIVNRRYGYENPFYWGAFIFLGEP